mmetsp:Transcript_9349/g.10307  ORF Transcript_9349/g.10307 Transcript_9349/m.10307 type:complete len:334 (-) Transcript_9349:129-1130(-)
MTSTTTPAHGPVMTKESMLATVNYAGVVLTSIDVVPSPTEENPDRVTFGDLTEACIDDDDALFLHDIKETKRGEGTGWDTTVEFEATKLTPAQAKEMIGKDKKALFVIHGFSTQASFHLADCLNAKDKFTKVNLIPVIWPSLGQGGFWDYRNDRKYSKAAGKALQSMKGPLQKMGDDVHASIVAHSMGNRVFRNFSDPSFNFDNIFMVAADVDGDIFHEDYINGGDDDYRKHGLNIKSMLTNADEGKIHVLFNPSDSRMFQSRIMNLGMRLGGAGVNMEPASWFSQTVHPDLKDSIVNVNALEENMLYPEAPGKSDHNYHFHDNVCKYYEDHA